MSYSIELSSQINYTKVIVTGTRRSGKESVDAANAWAQVAKYCELNKVKKLLIISNLHGKLPVLSSYDVASSLLRFGITKDIQVAFIDMNKGSREINSFTSFAAQKLGVKILVTDNEYTGINWLVDKRPK